MQERPQSPKEAAKRAGVELDAQLERERRAHERQQLVERSLATIEEAALDASWSKGNCETAFEPFEQWDPRWLEIHGSRCGPIGLGWQPEGSPGPPGAPPG